MQSNLNPRLHHLRSPIVSSVRYFYWYDENATNNGGQTARKILTFVTIGFDSIVGIDFFKTKKLFNE